MARIRKCSICNLEHVLYTLHDFESNSREVVKAEARRPCHILDCDFQHVRNSGKGNMGGVVT